MVEMLAFRMNLGICCSGWRGGMTRAYVFYHKVDEMELHITLAFAIGMSCGDAISLCSRTEGQAVA